MTLEARPRGVPISRPRPQAPRPQDQGAGGPAGPPRQELERIIGGHRIRHPARYSKALVPVLATAARNFGPILDPFAGVGGIAAVAQAADVGYVGVELEPEWVELAQANGANVVQGNALALPFVDYTFGAVVTSPCVTPDHRVLTADLRWIPAGDVELGDKLLAFDEFSPCARSNGRPARRRWRFAEVTYSRPARKECVRVHLATGEAFTCTADHPWLATPYRGHRSRPWSWVRADELMGLYAPQVGRVLTPWSTERGYSGGWLAGMFDGEGSLSFGGHGAPKLCLSQFRGPIAERAKALLADRDLCPAAYPKGPDNPVENIHVGGGYANVLRALGSLRPGRLLDKFAALDASTRCISIEPVAVEAVEPAGRRDIQGLETSTGTFVGEGYLQHNTYANRMADHHEARDASRRNTYRHALGRALAPENSGAMQWGREYRSFHLEAWLEARRVLRPGGRLVLNIKDHIRKGERVHVTAWHDMTLRLLGFDHEWTARVRTPGQRHGANGAARIPYESVLVYRKAAL